MAVVKVKQVIPHPDGAVIIVPEDPAQRSFVLSKEEVQLLDGVKAGDKINWHYPRR